MKLGIIKSFKDIDPLIDSYQKACDYCGVEYIVLDLLEDNWIDNIRKADVDGVLVREKGNIQEYKSMYDERLWVINKYLKIPIYPSWHELFLYENKRMYAYFLQSHNIKHPATHIFYDKKRALDFCDKIQYPIVFKTNGGASGSGVRVISNKNKAKTYVKNCFGRIDARLAFGNILWGKYAGIIPVPKIGMSQRHFVIMQEFVNIDTEWRIIRIGKTYAGYKRPTECGYASCELMEYGFPPIELLKLIKKISDDEKIDSLSLDVLVSKDQQYYVTEMQSLYGSFSLKQCVVKGVSGRIVFRNNEFIFEKGSDFFIHNSNVLRVKDFIDKLKMNYYSNQNK